MFVWMWNIFWQQIVSLKLFNKTKKINVFTKETSIFRKRVFLILDC